ncbi:MAG: NAD(P)H-hydrate epimerase [Chloroflexia bacterium]|nr:NAD(P)H-hydrate epimerase [Chloroflexia bacterium]
MSEPREPAMPESDAATSVEIPAITTDEMAQVDRIMADEYGVTSLQLMELAGHAVATYARQHFCHGDVNGKRILALCGGGGNGGDAMVAVRLLHAWGAHPQVFLTRDAGDIVGDAAHQLATLRAFDIPIEEPESPTTSDSRNPTYETTPTLLPESDLILDGLLGFGGHGAPKGRAAELIRATNAAGAQILAIDIPSGLDATTGDLGTPCIRAKVTLTLGLPKRGLREATARTAAGRIVVADIGIPPQVYERIGKHIPTGIFSRGSFREWSPT